jgi:protein involved in polysaccharide export with SLBB domain
MKALCLGIAMVLACGCASRRPTVQVAEPNPKENHAAETTLEPGDCLLIVLTRTNGPNRYRHEFREIIKPEGNITPFLAGDVPAAGKSRLEVQEGIEKAYAATEWPPKVSVDVCPE